MRTHDEYLQLTEHHVLAPVSHVFIHDRHVSQFQIDAAVQFLHREVREHQRVA